MTDSNLISYIATIVDVNGNTHTSEYTSYSGKTAVFTEAMEDYRKKQYNFSPSDYGDIESLVVAVWEEPKEEFVYTIQFMQTRSVVQIRACSIEATQAQMDEAGNCEDRLGRNVAVAWCEEQYDSSTLDVMDLEEMLTEYIEAHSEDGFGHYEDGPLDTVVIEGL